MLLWTLHPQYLDDKGLGGLWFEGIIARNCLMGLSKGWHNHPQLKRFKEAEDPVAAIDTYLLPIYAEGTLRGFNYNLDLFEIPTKFIRIPVSSEQIEAEYQRLLEKLMHRAPAKYAEIEDLKEIEPHPMFDVRVLAVR